MNEIDISNIPTIDPVLLGQRQITYNEIMQNLSGQLSDKFFYLAIFFLFYVLMNMYVFKEGARLRSRFEVLCDKGKYPLIGSSVGAWIYEIIEDIALMGSLMLVILNVVYRWGINL